MIKFIHNHELENYEAKRYRVPNTEVQQAFLKMFEDGINAAAALKCFKDQIMQKCNDAVDYLHAVSDRSICPDLHWVYKFYQKACERKFGSVKNREALQSLKTFVSQQDSSICRMKELPNGNFVVAIYTKLMQRISAWSTAAEVLFLDATGSADRFGLKVFLLVINPNCGGCPIGVVISSSETEEAITEAISLYLGMTDSSSFGGKRGPENLISDDCTAEINALMRIFPKACHYLSIFHVLQAVYRYLVSSKNVISKCKKIRHLVYEYMKLMVYAENEEKLLNAFDELLKLCPDDESRSYFEGLFSRREKWATCYRKKSYLRGSNTNKFNERQMRVIKENILNRLRAQSPAELVHYFLTDYDKYYSMKLIDISIDQNNEYVKSNSLLNSNDENYKFKKINDLQYTVFDNEKGVEYDINTQNGTCSCFVGGIEAYCEHQKMLSTHIGITHPLYYLSTEHARSDLFFTATGKSASENFFSPLQQTDDPLKGISNMGECCPQHCSVDVDADVSVTEHKENIVIINDEGKLAIRDTFLESFSELFEKFSYSDNVMTAISQATRELSNLQNGSEADVISAWNTFNKYNC